jgi:phage terminase large subunit-like protein
VAWAVANAQIEPKGDTIFIAKQASGPAEIDPLPAAAFCAKPSCEAEADGCRF